jgi:hypothetical protein
MLLISAAVSYPLFPRSSLPQLRGPARAAPTALRYADEAPSNSSDPPPILWLIASPERAGLIGGVAGAAGGRGGGAASAEFKVIGDNKEAASELIGGGGGGGDDAVDQRPEKPDSDLNPIALIWRAFCGNIEVGDVVVLKGIWSALRGIGAALVAILVVLVSGTWWLAKFTSTLVTKDNLAKELRPIKITQYITLVALCSVLWLGYAEPRSAKKSFKLNKVFSIF